MALMSGNDWSSDVKNKNGVQDDPTGTSKFQNQQGKPVKALIGVALLVVLTLVLSRMHPAPHEISSDPDTTTTSQTTGAVIR